MRRVIFLICTLTMILVLTGCGFHLRGSQGDDLSVNSVHVSSANAYGLLSRELESMLSARGIELVPASSAEYSIAILSENTSRRPVATSIDISVAEYELTLATKFQVTGANGDIVIAPTTLATERIYSFDRTSLVGNTEEEKLLGKEMRRDIVQQIIRRLASTLLTQNPT